MKSFNWFLCGLNFVACLIMISEGIYIFAVLNALACICCGLVAYSDD